MRKLVIQILGFTFVKTNNKSDSYTLKNTAHPGLFTTGSMVLPPRAGQTPFLDTEGHSEFPSPNVLAPWKLLEPDHHEAIFPTFKMTDLRGHLLFQSRRRCAKGLSRTLTWWSISFMNPKVDSPPFSEFIVPGEPPPPPKFQMHSFTLQMLT